MIDSSPEEGSNVSAMDDMDLDALLSSLEGIDDMGETAGTETEPEQDIFSMAEPSEEEVLDLPEAAYREENEDISEAVNAMEAGTELEEMALPEEETAAEPVDLPQTAPEDLSGEAEGAPAESKMLSPEEIEAMFAQMDEEEAQEEAEKQAQAEVVENVPEEENSEDDLLAMLENMDVQDENLDEINSILEKEDNNEIIKFCNSML